MPGTWELMDAVRERMADERGTIIKVAPLRCAMLYPSPYRAGMSSLGFQVMYRLVNERPDWVAERAFLPDDPEAYRASRTPLFTYESQKPVSEFHVVGVSLSYELELPGLFEALELSDLPLRAADRGEHDAIVVLGGPLTFSNPLPAAPFADIVVMGEGEEVFGAVLDLVGEGLGRDEVIERAAKVPGLYVPRVHGERLLPTVAAADSWLPGYGQIRTPHTELTDMHLVESERGCHRRCSFCVMRRSTNGGMRLASVEDVLGTIPDDARRVGLVGAAVSDHPDLIPMVEAIVAGGREIGLSSLRADRLNDELVSLLRQGGYQTLTVASDGASERLRISLLKAIREKHLMEAAHLASAHGMRTLKVYMMVGVPGETEADIDELVGFVRELAKIHRVALGIAPFVAKRNTPMDRMPFAGVKPVERTLHRLQRDLRGVADVRSTSARWAWVEYAMAQGGFDMADAAEQAWRDGGSFAAWKKAIKQHARDEQPSDEALRLGRPEGRFAHEAWTPMATS